MHNHAQDAHRPSLLDPQRCPQTRVLQVVKKIFHFQTLSITHTNYSHSYSASFSLPNIKDQESHACSPGNHLISCKDHLEYPRIGNTLAIIRKRGVGHAVHLDACELGHLASGGENDSDRRLPGRCRLQYLASQRIHRVFEDV
jgi:hypothetical protein